MSGPHLISRSQVRKEKRIEVAVVLPTYELMRGAVKIILRPKSQAKRGQIDLFTERGRRLSLDVLRVRKKDNAESVLASGRPKEVALEASEDEKSVTLFFHSAKSFETGNCSIWISETWTLESSFHPEGSISRSGGIFDCEEMNER